MGRGVNIEQVYIPYWKWECYSSGMWNNVSKDWEPEMLSKALKFTAEHIK